VKFRVLIEKETGDRLGLCPHHDVRELNEGGLTERP